MIPPRKLTPRGPLRLLLAWLNELRDWCISLRLKPGLGYRLRYETDGIALEPDFKSIAMSSNGQNWRGEWNPYGSTDEEGSQQAYKKDDIVIRGSRNLATLQYWDPVAEAVVAHDIDAYWAAGDVCGTYICIKDCPAIGESFTAQPEPKEPNDTEPGSLYWETLATASPSRLAVKGANGTIIDLNPAETATVTAEIKPRLFTYSDNGVQKTMWIMASESTEI